MADRFSKAKDFASEKWSDLAAAVGTQRQVRALQKEIADRVGERDRVMVEIGRKVYALYGRDKVRNADIIPLCERIEELGAEIDGLNVELQEALKPEPQGELTETELADETELEAGEEEAQVEPEAEPAAPAARTSEEEAEEEDAPEDEQAGESEEPSREEPGEE